MNFSANYSLQDFAAAKWWGFLSVDYRLEDYMLRIFATPGCRTAKILRKKKKRKGTITEVFHPFNVRAFDQFNLFVEDEKSNNEKEINENIPFFRR